MRIDWQAHLEHVTWLLFGVALTMSGLALAGMPAEQQKSDEHQCCIAWRNTAARLGVLKAGIVDAMNESRRGNHTAAQERAMRGLALSGFSCRTIDIPNDARGEFVCVDASP